MRPMQHKNEKPKNIGGTMKKLYRICKKYGVAMILAMVCAVVGTVLTLIGPDKLSEITDLIMNGIMTGIDMEAVNSVCLTLVMFYAASFILSVVQNWIMATVTQRVSQGLRGDITRKIDRLPMGFFHKTTTGDVLSRVTNDVDTVGQSLNQSVGTLVSAVVLFVGSIAMMVKTNLILTVTAIVSTLIGFVLMFAIMSKSQKYFSRQQRHLGALNGQIEEIYSGHTVVKAYNGEQAAKRTFSDMNRKLQDSGFKAQCLSGMMMPLMSFIGNFGYVAVCVVGGALVLNGNISFGVIIAFMMYVRYFTQPLSQMAQAMQSLQSAAAA